MKNVVYDSLSIEEFESRWIELIRSFQRMSTTQRVERIHHFFKGFMNAKTSLIEFVQKYTRAIEFRANAEKVATANDDRRKTKIKINPYGGEEVQTECLALIYVLPATEEQFSETVIEYTLIERIQVGDFIDTLLVVFKVTVGMEKLEFNCSCHMFEHKGILCRHCIRAMEMTNIPTVPQEVCFESMEEGREEETS
ncbi:Protein FAR-RED IMPAIRED RESPONSE 1 [Bienertia sinuspersici]